MSYTNGLDKPDLYFNTKLYTGNSSTQSISGINFKPDFTWIKARNQAYNHFLFDIARGVQKRIKTNSTDAESTVTGLTSFDTDGFSLGSNVDMNGSGVNFASWNWLASNTTASNTDGSITSTVSANTTSGFSIVSYTGTGANATVGHGLGAVPQMLIVKNRSSATENWRVYHASLGNTKEIYLDLTNASFTSPTTWNNTTPTSSVFSIGTVHGTNKSSDNYIAYCFAEKKGFSKFGSYTGNGSTDGTFVYTGFRPAWVMMKRTDTTNDWFIYDSTRNTFNETNLRISANSSSAESTQTTNQIDILSNGFKCRGTAGATNLSGGSYIYMCFAENPFVTSTGIPCTAR